MIDFNCINIIGIIISGFLLGFLSGLFGVGGGFLIVPILRIIFGIPYNLAVGSTLTRSSAKLSVKTFLKIA